MEKSLKLPPLKKGGAGGDFIVRCCSLMDKYLKGKADPCPKKDGPLIWF